ncbi:hypothetical protein Ppa06_10130 [Planomonospora parontospora subsp. parontospora]|uniref:Uncharacterized protein n=2 Tax=Planomonospora parontospora TaxID=58119 RepID=A0AA37BC06_9ACTN|nr:hypothetical protein [Planomonospora parontospora]GGK49592.1 hypothetical protein GCM10010126_06480 [Planomonospora parontospora]GII07215.1 hypothetical protein Ppa06_10130 [Planomonospora parontospora subsp. parontospora]
MQESRKWLRAVRAAAAVLGGALVAGLVVGVAARLLMRTILLAVDMPTSFSAGGTAAVLVAFAVLAVPAAATATARPAVRRAGRWVTVALTGWGSARNGLADAKMLLLADEERLSVVAGLIVAFAVTAALHGRLAQYATRRLAGPPATGGEAGRADTTGGDEGDTTSADTDDGNMNDGNTTPRAAAAPAS